MTLLAVIASFAVAHLLSNFVRSANAVIAGDLTRDLGLGASELGWTTSVYFLAFAAAQLPLGAALDRYGARRVTPALMALAVVGALVFAAAQGVVGLAAGRALLGLGTAGILMGGLKALAGWYRPARFAAVSGALVAFGSTGSLLAATPLAWASHAFGWRAVFGAAALALAASAASVAAWGRAAPTAGPDASGGGDGGFAAIFASPAFWRAAGLAIATTGVVFALQSLWAGPYLNDGVGLSRIETGNVLAAFGVGVSAGYLTLGALAERVGVGRTLAIVTAAFVLCQAFLATLPPAGGGLLTGAFVLLGLSGASSALLFARMRAAFPASLTGRAVTAVNLFMFAGGFALQGGLGVLLDAGPGGHGTLFAVTAGLGAVAWVAFLPDAFSRPAAPRSVRPG
jgi:predicted MFS family arabinose efflux permease